MPKKNAKKPKNSDNVKRAELRREFHYGKYTLSRAVKEWKKLCSDIAVPKMREDALNCSHFFEKIIDTKDYVISLYMDELKTHEDMYQINLQNHQENIEKLMLDFFDYLTEIHEENNNALMNLIQTSLGDWQKQIDESDCSDNCIKTINYGLEILDKRWKDMARSENFARVSEFISKHNTELQNLTARLESKLEGLWKSVKSVEEDYRRHIKRNKKRYDVLIEADRVEHNNIDRELKKVMKLNSVSKRLTAKLNELVGSIGRKLEHLEEETEFLREVQIVLRSKLQQDRIVDDSKLTLMVVEFSDVFEDLGLRLKRGESMIKLLSGLHKYELTEEKIFPYPHRLYGRKNVEKFTPPEMMLFWKRVATADANRYTLNEERIYLRKENAKLLKKIHTFCECLQCPANPQIPKRAGRIPYTEGREMIKKKMTQNGTKKFDEDYDL